jgi:GH43 family beta-xylosidase
MFCFRRAEAVVWTWLVLTLGALGTCASVAGASEGTFTGPLAGGADPWVIEWKGQYFYTRTTGSDVRLSRSPYLPKIVSNTKVVWDPPAGEPYGRNLWAPELHRLDDKWYMYVAADDGVDANHRMYVLEGNSQDPHGTYSLKGQISIPENRWAIDGTVMEHGGKDYFIWSGRTNGTTQDIGGSQSLYIAEMSNPWTLTGQRTRISVPQYSWEKHGHPVNEAPQILRNGDDVFLTYSASGCYRPEYALGLIELVGDDPLSGDSWSKRNQPVFTQGNGIEGVGHASFVKSPDGAENWMVYHGRVEDDPARKLFIQPFLFGGDGLPNFGSPIAPGTSIASPSGDPLVTYISNGAFDRTDVTINGTAGIASGIRLAAQ